LLETRACAPQESFATGSLGPARYDLEVCDMDEYEAEWFPEFAVDAPRWWEANLTEMAGETYEKPSAAVTELGS